MDTMAVFLELISKRDERLNISSTAHYLYDNVELSSP
jgi:hypothetical protein